MSMIHSGYYSASSYTDINCNNPFLAFDHCLVRVADSNLTFPSNICGPHGACVSRQTGFLCSCHPGYSGLLCRYGKYVISAFLYTRIHDEMFSMSFLTGLNKSKSNRINGCELNKLFLQSTKNSLFSLSKL